jgi:hypothetical protein
MPISEEEWRTGREANSWVKTIFEYLDDNYPKACSPADIAKEFFDAEESEMQNAIFVSLIVSNLEILMDRGAVEAKSVDSDEYEGMTYYRRAEDVDSLDRQRP